MANQPEISTTCAARPLPGSGLSDVVFGLKADQLWLVKGAAHIRCFKKQLVRIDARRFAKFIDEAMLDPMLRYRCRSGVPSIDIDNRVHRVPGVGHVKATKTFSHKFRRGELKNLDNIPTSPINLEDD
jgi:hypothetical protein